MRKELELVRGSDHPFEDVGLPKAYTNWPDRRNIMSHAERLSDRELEQIFPGESALAGLMRALEARIP